MLALAEDGSSAFYRSDSSVLQPSLGKPASQILQKDATVTPLQLVMMMWSVLSACVEEPFRLFRSQVRARPSRDA